eukprot:768781_1
METKSNITSHIAMHSYVQPDDDSMSRDTMSNTHTMTRTETVVDLSPTSAQSIAGNPKHWEWKEVKSWLEVSGLHDMVVVFQEGPTQKEGTDGVELLNLDLTKLYEEAGHYKAGVHLNISSIHAAEASPLIQRFFRELTRLKLKANESSNDFTEREATIDDVVEMKRRISLFVEKWDRIIWIDQYLETNAELPTETVVSEELGVSLVMSQVYLNYHQNQEREKKKEVDELILDFNVYNDCVLWWYIIMEILGTAQTKAIWLLFNRVAELTPSNVAFSLLDKYKFDLTRFDAHNLEELAQNIVVGSQYAICAALRMSKFFIDIAEYDVARAAVFENVSESFIDAAFDYLNLIESDHMATVILEVKSDIEAMSAFDMALEYELTKFVTDQRIERITTSIMNNFEFLKASNRDEAFEISPLSLDLVWKKMFESTFYFTPLGLYITTIVLYICYLALFSYLSTKQFRVYDEMGTAEVIFWVFNTGYVLNEVQQMFTSGAKDYFADRSNYFDVVISVVFIASMSIRYYCVGREPNCDTEKDKNCWHSASLNTAFVILWGIATITLWVRLVNFCTLSHKLGPMVQMIFKMMDDIVAFFEIMFILFLGFAFALMFILGDVHPDFDTPLNSALTLFIAIVAEFDFGAFKEATDEYNEFLVYFGYGVMILYLIIGSLVLLNLLVAMMATTYESIDENATSAIIFARFQLALSLDDDPSFMPPPLNLVAIVFLVMFYAIEWIIKMVPRCCSSYERYDLITLILPKFMKKRKIELDEQILFANCGQYWTIATDRGETRCKAFEYDYKLHQHEITFYDEHEDEIEVSVEDAVEKKDTWLLDLMHLYEVGLLKLEQFEEVGIDLQYINKAKNDMKSSKNTKKASKYWLCGFCRSYVKESKSSIKRLGRLLNVNDMELKIINKVLPIVCPNCYRKRFHRKRWELVWEIISIRIWYILVFPLFLMIFGCVLLLKMIQDLDATARRFEVLKSKLMGSKDKLLNQNTQTESRSADKQEQARYVTKHYKDKQLIAMLNTWSTEHPIFDPNVRDIVWEKLDSAKDAIDPLLLKEKITNHVMNISTEDELGPFEFFEDYVDMASLKRNGGARIWNEYFEPFSRTIFERIQHKRRDYLPLHLFSRYPFDLGGLLDDLEDYFRRTSEDEHAVLSECSKEELLSALNKFRFLNCTSSAQRKHILNSIDKNDSEHHSIYAKFVNYLVEVSSLFQNVRKIKNMLRDVNTAIIERGVSASLLAEQIYFLFDDIRHEIAALPFFNSMRTYTDGYATEKRVELWTIRNTLQTLYFLNHATRKYILEHTKKTLVSKKQIFEIVCKLYAKDITDPDNITTHIETEKDAQSEDGEDEDDADEDETDQFNSLSNLRGADSLHEEKSFDAFAIGTMRGPMDTNEANNDDYREENEAQQEEKQKIEQERWQQFYKQEITASAIQKELESMFDKLQARRDAKVSETTIDYYRRHLTVRLLTDDELLRFIYEQMARYITFNPANIHDTCELHKLKLILIGTVSFDQADDKYKIDEETIPKVMHNPKYIEQLHKHLVSIFVNTAIIDKHRKMTVQDAAAIIMLYERIFEVIQDKIVDSADAFVVHHALFCKFVDPQCPLNVDIDYMRDSWSNKTLAASNLYQSVLDIQQKFVTLGQVRQTIMKLYTDIDGLECGELMRLMNHIAGRKRIEANTRQSTDLSGYSIYDTPMTHSLTVDSQSKYSLKLQNSKALQYEHINHEEWNQYINKIASSFEHNICSKTISDTLNNTKDDDDAKYNDGAGSSQRKKKKIIDVLLENTVFDIIIADHKPETPKPKEHLKELKEARNKVFDTVLSFNARRITLQQLYEFAHKLGTFLNGNAKINRMMKRYIGNSTEEIEALKKRRIKKKIDDLEFWRELEWIYQNTQTLHDLCRRVYPFWSYKFIEIFDFIETTKQIDGLYELKWAEFGQLKLKMKVNDEECSKLFHIIRCKYSTLSWKQIYNYLKFVIKMKYNVQKAILNAKQSEDETISHGEMKLLLNISSNDESKWLFQKVLLLNGSKVTWKQIISYLEKMVAVRDDMRDFFEDQERDRNYLENRAEIMGDVQQNIEKIEGKMELLDMLKEMKAQITSIEEKIGNPIQSSDHKQEDEHIVMEDTVASPFSSMQIQMNSFAGSHSTGSTSSDPMASKKVKFGPMVPSKVQ